MTDQIEEVETTLAQQYKMIDELIAENRELLLKLAKL